MPQPSKQRGPARARMFIKSQMGWLPGVPLSQVDGEIVWLTLPTSSDIETEQLVVTRTQLQQATLTYSKLTHRFPKALPQVIDDLPAWKAGVPKLLDLLKPAVHAGESLPHSLVEAGFFDRAAVGFSAETRTNHPQLSHLIDALSWLTCLTPALLQPSLTWLRTNAAHLTTLNEQLHDADRLRVPLQLWELQRRDGIQRVQPLLDLFCMPAARGVPFWGDKEYVQQVDKALNGSTEQVRKLEAAKIKRLRRQAPEMLDAWLNWLLSQRQGVRRRALDLFATLALEAVQSQRAAWWQQLDPIVASCVEADFMLAKTATRRSQFYKLKNNGVVELPLYELLAYVQYFAERVSAETHQLMINSLSALPTLHNERPLRAVFLTLWRKWFGDRIHVLDPWLMRWQRLLAPDLLPATLRCWQSPIEKWPRFTSFTPERSFRVWEAAAPWQRALDTLPGVLTTHPHLTIEQFEFLYHLSDLSSDPAWVAETLCALVTQDNSGEPFEADLDALRFCTEATDTIEAFVALYAHMNGRGIGLIKFRQLTNIAALLKQAGWRDMVMALSYSDQFAQLERIAALHTLLIRIVDPIAPPATPIPDVHPAWVANYPAVFASYLAALATLNENAETVAARVLGKAFPTQAQLSAELAHLATLPPSDKLQKRQASLQKRLAQSGEPKPSQVEKFGRKLQLAIWRAVLIRWEADMLSTVNTALTDWLQLDSLPAWLSKPPELNALTALMDLSGAWHAVGRQLLQKRSGQPPWDLREHPANQKFLTQIAERGMAIERWLTPPPAQTVTGEDGKTVTLRINDDPLAVFQMGSHFNTCLSVGSFNYFSVFANAADINKRVLFAYDSEERVVGRCLIALTDLGGLLTFHPYCHDGTLGFRQMVAAFVNQWAAQLGTTVLPNGTISQLVAHDWYDDGSVDLCHQFPFLDRDSPFRSKLRSLPESEFAPLLEQAFAPLGLNEMTLPLVLELSELSDRPQLVRPLLPLLLQVGSMNSESWARVIQLAQQAKAHSFVEQVVESQLVPLMQQQLRDDDWIEDHLLQMLARYRPSRALRLLHATRRAATGFRHGEERFVGRLQAYAIAYEGLNRPKQAAEVRSKISELQH